MGVFIKQHALKGQKLLAQGNALGIKAISKSPCKGKSFTNCPWSFKAFALTGRQVCEQANPGRCPGLRASALSGRAACGRSPGLRASAPSGRAACGRCPWAMNFWASGRVALCLSGRTNFSNFPNNFFNFCIKKKEITKMKENNKIAGSVKAIAFDADDTLWALQNYFEDVEDEYCDLLSDYGSKEEISASLFETESGNMEDLGYGVKAFTISLVENAVKVSQGEVPAKLIGRIVELGKTLLRLDARPLEGVEETLARLRQTRHYKLAVFTKGELQDQENKLWRSGLQRYFDVVSIVSDKTPEAYRRLCRELEVKPEELVMVGNSFKSDIVPALKIGASAVHIPFHTTWAHEKTEEFAHERLRRISRFEEIMDIL